MIALFLQVRLGSTRLPGKALLPLAGRTVVEHAMAALGNVPAELYALLTEPDSAEALAPYARACGFELYIGPKDDVLARYAGACRVWKPDTVIRATGDNPLVSWELAREILRLHHERQADYSGFLDIPIGSGVEILRTEALFTAEREAVDPYEREHVSPFLYRRPARFLINRPLPEARYRLPDARVTLDTPEDYARITAVFDTLYAGSPIGLDTLVGVLAEQASASEPAAPGRG